MKATESRIFLKQKRVFLILLVTSICFIVVGIIREEHLVVVRKAIKICLECIGVG